MIKSKALNGFKPFLLPLFAVVLTFFAPTGQALQVKFKNLEGKRVPLIECSSDLLAKFPPPTIRLGDEENIIFSVWNVENVMNPRGKFDLTGRDAEKGTYTYSARPEQNREMPAWKFPAKQKKILDVGRYLELPGAPLSHFFISPEVEDIVAANRLFNTGPLAGKYRTFLVDGNDPRGIDVAFAVRADLRVRIEMETHKDVTWIDIEGTEMRLFSRDIPTLFVFDLDSNRLKAIVFGNHSKSKRDRPGDRESNKLRTAQHEAEALIVQSYAAKYPGIPIFGGGDFNTNVLDSSELNPLKKALVEVFEKLGLENRFTQSFHPDNTTTIAQQLDALFVTQNVVPYLRRAMVLPEFDHITGALLPQVPKSFRDRQQNYISDHRAFSVIVDGKVFRD